jgi:hypothetical protein
MSQSIFQASQGGRRRRYGSERDHCLQYDLAKKIAAAQPDCANSECEESTTEVCSFMHTESKKPKCMAKGPGFKCVGWIRPGCFCFEPDVDVKGSGAPGAAGGGEKKD